MLQSGEVPVHASADCGERSSGVVKLPWFQRRDELELKETLFCIKKTPDFDLSRARIDLCFSDLLTMLAVNEAEMHEQIKQLNENIQICNEALDVIKKTISHIGTSENVSRDSESSSCQEEQFG